MGQQGNSLSANALGIAHLPTQQIKERLDILVLILDKIIRQFLHHPGNRCGSPCLSAIRLLHLRTKRISLIRVDYKQARSTICVDAPGPQLIAEGFHRNAVEVIEPRTGPSYLFEPIRTENISLNMVGIERYQRFSHE